MKTLLPSARSAIAVGKLYNAPQPYSTQFDNQEVGWISRYAWGDDYHTVVRKGLERLTAKLASIEAFDYKICVDTAPLLERALARQAGIGWIGKNTCLIHEGQGSWFFLGELLVSLELESDSAPADRCGTCARCIEACPTDAIVPTGRPEGPSHALDSRLCISYLTIELRGPVSEELRAGMGRHIFGCDICQDVCPWNRRAPVTGEAVFQPRYMAPPLEKLAALSEQEFRELFWGTPVPRARYAGFLRNVAIAMGNSGIARFREPLERLAQFPEPVVAEHARWGLERLKKSQAARANPSY